MNGLQETDFQKYNQILEEHISFRYIMVVAFLVLFIVFAVVIITGWARGTKKDNTKKSKILCILMVFAFFMVLWGFLGYQIYTYKSDIKNQAYLVYEGEFVYNLEYEYRKNEKTEVIIVVDGEEISLYTEKIDIDNGTYRGQLVYSKKSKILLDYKIYE